MTRPPRPEVLSKTEIALELDGHGFSLYRVGNEAQLRDPDGRIVVCGPWRLVPIWVEREFRAAEREAEELEDDRPRHPDDSWVARFNEEQRNA